MPFERYLRADEDDNANIIHDPHYALDYDIHDARFGLPSSSCYGDGRSHYAGLSNQPGGANHHHYPNAVQFQIPQFMLDGPPILAPGGGAEVLPAGLLDSRDSLASSWFANSGFAPFHSVSKQHPSNVIHTDHSTPALSASGGFDGVGYSRDNQEPSGSYSTSDFTSLSSLNANLHQHSFPEQLSQSSLTAYPDHVRPALAQTTPSFPISPHSSFSQQTLVPTAPLSLTAPSALGLPVYSSSGFDLLSILSRVASRPNPTIQLGPVDLSCSFAIADVRRHDSPIVYASPSFYRLTGYSEHEVIGRNCRFLQSPTGHVAKGDVRRFVSPDAVAYMRKSLSSGKECQISLVNYKKGGQAFINLVTVIPLRGGVYGNPSEADDIVYHVGFQVDLTEQPGRILEKLRDGSYCTTYSTWSPTGIPDGLGACQQLAAAAVGSFMLPPRGSKAAHLMGGAVSKSLKNLIADITFTNAVPISTSTNLSGTVAPDPGGTTASLTAVSTSGSGHPLPATTSSSAVETLSPPSPTTPISPALSLLLLELLPDFLLVLSLKGLFLYVAPSVRLVLGYEPHELVGRNIADVCHPADLVPLMRELKEGSVSTSGVFTGSGPGSGSPCGGIGAGGESGALGTPKPVDLLFRAAPKTPSHPIPPFSLSSDAPPTSTSVSIDTECTLRPYIWLECRGRLHAEPGKGRKAIILSGRARWMPSVRWSTVKCAGGIGISVASPVSGSDSNSRLVDRGQGLKAGSSTEPPEFWALLAPAGTFLVASAGIRDILGWGVGEVIGRSLWGMVADSAPTGATLRAHVEAELARLQEEEVITEAGDPQPIIYSIGPHAAIHIYPPVDLLIYEETPFARSFAKCLPASSRESGVKVDSRNNGDVGNAGLIHPTNGTLFEELDTTRGSSWQYELQQLKFANQRLHEELDALEGATGGCTESVAVTNSGSNGSGAAPAVSTPSSSGFPVSGSSLTPTQAHTPYQSLLQSVSSSGSLSNVHNMTHVQGHQAHPQMNSREVQSMDWLGAHGMTNPLKRTWNSDDRAV
ncbi:hypothetical protein ID866_326 [Astraeus odoratus]|nr:hypothetical protein ID866_326 [Astraeus odoratus]